MTFKELYETAIDDLFEKKTDLEMIRRLKNYINRGYKEVAKRECLSKTIKVVANNGRIRKPIDLIKVNKIVYENNILEYNVTNKEIEVTTNGSCDFNYMFVPEVLEDNDDETITNPLNDEFILSYAKWCYFMADNMYDDANKWKQEYESFKITREPLKSEKICDVIGVI